ncbi:sensor histidine kinase [Luteimonas salinisoli]|uniref:sensor histidine kinase n=1 Tax=Luteimonas salinisoli TaxID=2752307 RepID=UPI001C5C900A
MPRHGLRKRVEVAFALCVVGLSLAWGFAFFGAIRLSEDRVVVNQLQRASDSYPDITTPLRGYDDAGSLPEPLRAWALTDPDEGTYEFVAEELHVAVIPADNAQGRAFVVFDVAGIEASSSEDWWWLLVITAVVGALGALGFGLGVLVIRRAVAPVVQLAETVAGIDLEHLSAGDHKLIESSRFGGDEVGVLAGAIETTLERISAFMARERDFTGAASHELRTPITVITGALELLEQSDLSGEDARAVDRIRRATLEMKSTIEMFLCIAREADDGSYGEHFLVAPLVARAIEQQRYLLNGKCVEVDVESVAAPVVHGHPQAFLIAVSNLVRNAFEQTPGGQGPITVLIKEHELRVTNRLNGDDTGRCPPASASSSNGTGLGLGIVQRLCERNGWVFTLHEDEDEASVTACLSW